MKFGMLQNEECVFCQEMEKVHHLLFECRDARTIWSAVFNWLNIEHELHGWSEELKWAIKMRN